MYIIFTYLTANSTIKHKILITGPYESMAALLFQNVSLAWQHLTTSVA